MDTDLNTYLENVVESMPGVFYWKNTKGIYLGCNDFNIPGLEKPFIIGKTDYDLYPKAEADKIREHDLLVINSGKVLHIEEYITLPNGKRMQFIVDKMPLKDKSGKIIGLIGVSLDITELKAAEMRERKVLLDSAQEKAKIHQNEAIRINKIFLKNIAEALPQYIFWKDTQSVYLGCNGNFAKLVGFNSPSEIVGKRDVDLNWQSSGDTTESFVKGDLQTMAGNPVTNQEEILVLPCGKKLITLASKLPIKDEKGTIFGIVGYFSDITQMKELEKELLESQKRELEAKAKKALIESAAQVSHDIRSPLAAINTVLKDLSGLPEKQRLLIRNAAKRINDIANNLLNAYRDRDDLSGGGEGKRDNHTASQQTVEWLSGLLNTLVSEKSAQIGGEAIELELDMTESALSLFAVIDKIQFTRVISNLLNNAIEALQKEGKITLKLTQALGIATLCITDNGCGIPEAVLEKIKTQGGSYGKKTGSGIGVATAIEFLKKSGGNFDIQSEVGRGTSVILSLPAVSAPDWFQSQLALRSGVTVVILDDDQSIHAIWDARFESYAEKVTLKHFYKGDDLSAYCQTADYSNVLFLIDYEILPEKESGLDLIKRLAIADLAVLVTSHYENPEIRQRVFALNVKILPKDFSPHVPITVDAFKQPELIFIDDDVNLTMAWEQRAEVENRSVLTFNKVSDFEKILPLLDKSITIYIDSNLGPTTQGEDFAKALYEQGFKTLYLATGYPENHFKDLYWIKAVVGKEPPF